MATTHGEPACPRCGMPLSDDRALCPICALREALETESLSVSDTSSELRFEHYLVLRNEEGKPLELGRGAMGLTYKAFDVNLQNPVALKIINPQFIGNESARLRLVREARAAARVRHPNVAMVFHLGESGGNYFYAMEFVDGETLQHLIRRCDRLEIELALDIVTQTAAGLNGIYKRHLVHRDIKPSNIMLTWEDGRLEHVKIIDLGLAKGVAEENTLSAVGSFIGTPAYASPEQFAGNAIDIRSDLYSLGITFWEMLSGELPFAGSVAELMHQHQYTDLPIEKLKNIPLPVVALLQVLLEKNPNQRLHSPAELQGALTKVRGAMSSESLLTADELRSVSYRVVVNSSKAKPSKQTVRWMLGVGLCFAALLLAWFFFSGHAGFLSSHQVVEAISTQKSIAVLPFESLSPNRDDTYFADGVQDEILNNLARVAQLKVISRTSVMQYRSNAKRDLRQISIALNVANVLEGTVRRNGNQVRISTELVDAQNDHMIWADTYDRDLTDIFAIQSEVAQTVAGKLTAMLSPAEKERIESKPTDNLEAYDLYLQATQLVAKAKVLLFIGDIEGLLHDAVKLLEQAVHLDPKFALAYCAEVTAHDLLYNVYEETSERRALGDRAIERALALQPNLPEVHLAYAFHLYRTYRDYERARVQLAIAKTGMPNDAEAMQLQAFIDRRQGNFEKAIEELVAASTLDPRNPFPVKERAALLSVLRRFTAAEQEYDRAIELAPDQPMLKILKALVSFFRTGVDTSVRQAIEALPGSMANDRNVLNLRLVTALSDRDWQRATELVDSMKGGQDEGEFGYAGFPVPVNCYFLIIARLQGIAPGTEPRTVEAREELNQTAQRAPGVATLISTLALVDALLGRKESAIAEAKRGVELLPVSKDAVVGPTLLTNLALVYAWTGETDLAIATLTPLVNTPCGPFYGLLRVDPLWDPLRNDPRFNKLLTELEPGH